MPFDKNTKTVDDVVKEDLTTFPIRPQKLERQESGPAPFRRTTLSGTETPPSFRWAEVPAEVPVLQEPEVTPEPYEFLPFGHIGDNLQSEEYTDTSSVQQSVEQAQTLQFRDGALSERLTFGDMSGGDFDADDDALGGLGDYLSRPVRIINFTWAENTALQLSYSPWQLYFNTAQIKKKLDNYARIHCNLKLKFVLNASPFYYGSLRACYFPLVDPRSTYTSVVDQVPFSQVPGVYLEPQNMSSAELTLPFIWPRNWLDATLSAEFASMGVLQILQYANLRSANGVSGSGINVSVYAWAEDVTVMGPTVALAVQSDEYAEENGVISSPATAVANVASKLTDVPVIGPFASATQMGASAIAGIAKLFGFSNPPMIDDTHPFMNKTFHAFANVETRMPTDKLSVDPKNEVTISNKVAGVSVTADELAFSELLTRESFLQGTLFSGSSTVDTLLWSSLVTPNLYLKPAAVGVTPPIGHFSQMFRYWRGSIIFKFRIIKTKYHKGRLLISWDPTGGNVSNNDTETTTLTRIVDLEYEDEVEFEVPYKATSPYLAVSSLTTGNFSNGASPSYSYDKLLHNGAITIRVQNVLTGPVLSPQVDILCYVRGGKDFVFAVPTNIPTNITISDPTGVIQSEEYIDGKTHSVDAQIAMITTGESLASVRPLLHRSSLSTIEAIQSNAGVAGTLFSTIGLWRIPRGVGRDPRGYNTAVISTVNTPYHFATNHPIDWVINCFVGVRGSVTHHLNVIGGSTTMPNVQHFSADRLYRSPILSGNIVRNQSALMHPVGNYGTISYSAVTGTTSIGQAGMSLTNPTGQPALSVNVPQYSNSRFTLAFKSVRGQDPQTTDMVYDELCARIIFYEPNPPVSNYILEDYVSAGVDFQPVFFLCTPRLFTTGTITPA